MERALCRLLEDDADRAISADVTVLVREVFRKPDGSIARWSPTRPRLDV